MYELIETVSFEHDTVGGVEHRSNRGRFTDKELAQELAAYGRAGWTLITTRKCDDDSAILLKSGIVHLNLYVNKV